jgi:phosphatidylglycerophosphatase C
MPPPESITAPGGASPGVASGAAAPAQQQLVFFDLDETITRHDTLFPYALGFALRRKPWRIPLLATVVPPVIGFLLGRNDEGKVKETFIKATLGGSRRAEITEWTARFVPRLLAGGLFADAVERVAEHRRQGDYLILMSASTDLYVPAIARELGFNETVCTQVRWDGDTLDGSLTTPNRKGREKARCFTSLKGRHPGLPTVAYGNSFSDLPHLCLANRGVLVNGSAKARLAAESFGVSCVRWS